ncbi:hypothetical protein [Sphingomonas chungangi]|nr:hypothetical protein [Sphingomonas chungangi]MVW54604.1 hypothetical protein [Sphingomonas chungangi]
MLSMALLGLAAVSPYSYYYLVRFDAGWLIGVMNTIGVVALVTTMFVFPNGRFVPRWTLWAILAFPCTIVAGKLLPAIAYGTIGFVILALIAMIVRYRRETPVGRRQWRWAMIGFVIGFAIQIGPSQIYSKYLGSPAGQASFGVTLRSWILTPLSLTASLTIIAMGVMLSVLRYRLYDTQAAVSRSILYGALTLALLAIFAGSEKIIEIVGEAYFGESLGALAGGLGAAFAAVAISPLHHRIGHWVEHRFRKNLIHLRHDLPPLLIELGETADPATVARTALDHLAHGLHAARGAVIADGAILAVHNVDATTDVMPPQTERPNRIGTLEVVRSDALFPVRLPLGSDGRWLLIGSRPDASLYDRQERELLTDLAPSLAQALRVAADRTARQAETAARFDQLERELSSLKAAFVNAAAAG